MQEKGRDKRGGETKDFFAAEMSSILQYNGIIENISAGGINSEQIIYGQVEAYGNKMSHVLEKGNIIISIKRQSFGLNQIESNCRSQTRLKN